MIVLLNDTSEYHYGSAEVVKNIDFNVSYKTPPNRLDLDGVTRVILNGEGTMHHDSVTAYLWLQLLKEAQAKNIPTEILNSVWQGMNRSVYKIVRKCENIEVRDVFSYNELKTHGVDSKIVPDRSVRTPVRYKKKPYVQIYYGQGFGGNLEAQSESPRIDIFTQPWEEIVNRLRSADLIVTGRHHEMYAAIKARCKFIVKKGNSWKNEGLIKTVTDDLPINPTIEDVLSGRYDEEYNKIFKWANN